MRTWKLWYSGAGRVLAMAVLAGVGAGACAATAGAQAGVQDQDRAPGHTDADVRFMQGMMAHHAQAVEMTGLVEARTEDPEIRLLARRIEVGQEDEMALMRRWLEDRGEAVPGPHAHHTGEHAGMPGMLTAQEMARLRAARGAEFDRLFLESMIHHHEGALVMVEALFATDGAGQESEIFQFATHVESDQTIEIARMRGMLGSRQ